MPAPQSSAWSMRYQAARELGLRRMAALAVYRLGLGSGHYRRTVNAALAQRLASGVTTAAFRPLWKLPTRGDLEAILDAGSIALALAQADEIAAGQARLFGALPCPLRFDSGAPWQDWTAYESGPPIPGPDGEPADIKLTWEPARFGWVYALGRAYLLGGDERSPQTFWRLAEAFLDANPPYLGPQWASAQEAALRLIALTFALHVFHPSPESTPERELRLLQSIAVHAGRIPATLAYARAQDNNHLLSEAAGLATAAALLPNHPEAGRWRRTGWGEFQRGLRSQIAADGAYSQHSANYHRLMLQLAVWMDALGRIGEPGLDDAARARLAASARWLLALVDPISGRVPNLGPNDGAYIFPLSVLPFEDYRPALQAAGQAFLGAPPFPHGAWDEMAAWFLPAAPSAGPARGPGSDPGVSPAAPHILRSSDGHSWAYLRAARFNARPGHADQLHLDLWRDGVNICLDPGTYSYNSPPPWDNALAAAAVHNTLTVDGLDQMQRAGRFLYVGRAQAEIVAESAGTSDEPVRLTARHDGYRRLGLIHQRQVTALASGAWEIVDTLAGPGWQAGGVHRVTVHWLFPDWPWQVETSPAAGWERVILQSPQGRIHLALYAEPRGGARDAHPPAPNGHHPEPSLLSPLQIVHAGEVVYGDGPASPAWGWTSPTYAVKIPALSVRYTVLSAAETRILSLFIFE